MREHTRNQKRMYRIHKQEEKILEQELMIEHLQHKTRNMFYAITKIVDERDELENIRKKAIEFINEWLFEAGGNGADMDYDTIVDLLNILNKGSEKE